MQPAIRIVTEQRAGIRYTIIRNCLPVFMLVVLTIVQGCHLNVLVFEKNDKIDPNIRLQMHALNDRLFKALQAGDEAGLKQMMIPELANSKNIPDFFNLAASLASAAHYKTLDEYYVENTTLGVVSTISAEIGDENDYLLHYLPYSNYTYLALLTLPYQNNEYLITVTYSRPGNEWKLSNINIGTYKVLNKTFADLYNMAQKSYSDSDLIDAVDYCAVSQSMLQPAGNVIEFTNQSGVISFYKHVMQEAQSKYRLPLAMETVSSKPQIFNIQAELENSFSPVVQYVSTVNLKNKAALKEENILVRKEIGQMFPGIDRNSPYIYYRVFNKIPDGKNSVHGYGFVDTLKYNHRSLL